MRRGHVYAMSRGGSTFTALVISDDLVNERTGGATVVQVHPAGTITPSLLATELEAPVSGVVVVDRFATFAGRHFSEDLGPIDARAMEAVEIGVRAVLNL